METFKSVCVEEDAAGFNWENSKWVSAIFKVNKRLVIQKINASKALSSARLNVQDGLPLSCAGDRGAGSGSSIYPQGCYLISKLAACRT
jgi:hypothetical protein